MYVGANIAGISLDEISRAAVPFILAMVAALALVILLPGLSTALPILWKLYLPGR